MKVIEKIKNIPKKRLLIISILTVLIAITIIVTFSLANRSKEPQASLDNTQPTDTDTVSVFKSIETQNETEKKTPSLDTAEPLDLAGINGLKYTSQGNGTCFITGLGTCEETELKIMIFSFVFSFLKIYLE